MVASYLILRSRYKLDEETYAGILRDLKERRNNGAPATDQA